MDGFKKEHGDVQDSNGFQTQPVPKFRVPTVHEALPYTPLSSIVPFNPDIIPAPSALPSPSLSTFSNAEETRGARRVLEQLTAGATSAETASKRCQQTLRDVQKLLDPDSLTKFKFKSRKPTLKFNSPIHTHTPELTPFAKMVLKDAAVQYRYLTPESQPDTGHAAIAAVEQSYCKNLKPLQNGHVTPQHSHPTPSSQQRKVQAVIPTSLTPAQRAEYQYLSDRDLNSHYDTPSNRQSNGMRVVSVDQRYKGDVAVQTLQNLLQELFEAEDQLQPDTSGAVSTNAESFFAIRDTEDGAIPVLQAEEQGRLESCVYKAVACGRLEEIEVEYLARAEKLCEPPVSALESLSLSIEDNWSESDVEQWLQRIGTAENGLTAARTMMRIMIGGASHKELQSEDFLRVTLEAIKAVVEGCIVPIVEEPPLAGEKIRGEKTAPPPNLKFVIALSNRKSTVSLLSATSKAMRLLGDLLVKTDLDETALSKVEYICKTLIFAENANSDKDSALGVQNFETLRRTAMDVLAKIFTKYTDQRTFILDEILVSLEKLPATKQSARQYRLGDSKPIQLVSALLMRLVQTSATRSAEALKLRSQASKYQEDGVEDSEDDASEDEDNIKVSPTKTSGGNSDVTSMARSLHDAAQSNASYIVKILVHRAATTTKSSDEPFRKLLDIFTEDFLNVLGSSDWPASELLLRTLVMHMIRIAEGDKSSVPSRTLALELLGTMGSGILELQMAARDAARSIDVSESHIASHLSDMIRQLESGSMEAPEFLSMNGPCRIVLQYLEAKNTSEDPQLQTAHGYHLTEWAYLALCGREGSTDSDASDTPRSAKEVQGTLNHMFDDPKWLDDHTSFPSPSTSEGRLAAMALTLNSKFCKAFNKIFTILLSSMSSEQSTVKSRSLKSVVTLLEKDATILDRNAYVLNHIFRCANDSSTLVRDSALGLIDKCISLRPELSSTVYKRVIERTKDAAASVRKRAMRMLKEIYHRNKKTDMRSAIANAIISRIDDTEDSVVEIARTTMEEIWFHSFYGLKVEGERAVDAKLTYASHAALFINTVEHSDEVLQVLESLLKRLLTTSKTAEANARVCKTLVAVLFDGIVDNEDIPGAPYQDSILRSLTVFARASPTLFTASQLERLEPYTQNLSNSDDLDIYRSVITILRNVMPYQKMMKEDFLRTMQTTLLTSVTRLQKPELREVAPCLWTINSMLGNIDRLVNFIISVLGKIHGMRGQNLGADEKTALTVAKLMRIAGEFGNACDFNDNLSTFNKKCPWYQGDSVPGLIVETVCPFTSPKTPLGARIAALEAICTISQAWPKQFLRADVTNAFEIVFKDRIPPLEEVLVTGLESFFVEQEVPDENEDAPKLGSGAKTGSERLGKTYIASDQDGASTALAQRFLSQILRIALSTCDEAAFAAARLVVSINKQGLVHPKESGPALVALETCPNKAVAGEAFKEHKSQHQKHESLFEKEYMRAVQQTFEYQLQVIGDSAGYTGSPPAAKMHLTWEVLKMGKALVRKKFLSNIGQKLDFDPSKLDVAKGTHKHSLFVRFCLENLAFFEYDRVDDLLHLISSLEKVFAGTGSSVAQAIESEVLKLQVNGFEASESIVVNGTSAILQTSSQSTDIQPERLRQLASSAQILYSIWETRSFLIRVWNMQRHMAKSEQQAKDANKAPNRATNALTLTDAYLRRAMEIHSNLDDEHAQLQVCKAFVELISVDSEVRVESDEEGEGDLLDGYGTPSEGSGRKSPSLPASGGDRGRKRKSMSTNSTPRKRGRPPMGKRKSTGKTTEGDDEDGDWD